MSDLISSAASLLGWSDPATDDLSIIVGGTQIFGWEVATVRFSIEQMPWTFEIETTEWAPDQPAEVTVRAGAPIQIMIGTDLVLTGLVVSVSRFGDAGSHGVRLLGASKSYDLTRNSALLSTFQIANINIAALASKLADPFGIVVVPGENVPTDVIQQFDVILTETPYEIIERVARYAAVLFYDMPDGNITLAQVGATVAASGFVLGGDEGNVERYDTTVTIEGRHSQISAVRQTTDTLFFSPDQSDLGGQMQAITAVGPVMDPTISRYSPLIIPAEMADQGNTVTRRRVQWEINRRLGRSFGVTVTCSSWRDASGAIWAVNTLAPLSLSAAKFVPSEPWLIVEVVLRRDGEGTHADITLAPPDAFRPEPILLNPLAQETAQALREQQGTAPSLANQGAPIPVDAEAIPGLIQ